MRTFNFDITGWLSSGIGPALERETVAALEIIAERTCVTEVYDSLAQTVRRHVNVPVYPLAHWLVVNWWRLRWEPERQHTVSPEWLLSHSMAAIGGDTPWPGLTFCSDGDFVHLRQAAERSPDVAAVRYLQNVSVDISAADFESAVDSLLDTVEARVSLRLRDERELSELRAELRQERADPELAALCKLQALAGVDPGSASGDWFAAVQELGRIAGAAATEEILAVVPSLEGGVPAAQETVDAMRNSTATVDLRWATVHGTARASLELPWERGARLAGTVRSLAGIGPGPLTQARLSELVGAALPLPQSTFTRNRDLRGGYRNGAADGRTAVLVSTTREENQRFYLARLIGAAVMSGAEQHVLAVSGAGTALQKAERSFAQELLCPWQDLKKFVAEVGTDDDAISDAAAHFIVSEQVIKTTLVNKKSLSRDRLE